jgi:hypothetical protein
MTTTPGITYGHDGTRLPRSCSAPTFDSRTSAPPPVGNDSLQASVYAAGERCKRARARGWIDEFTEALPEDE